MSEEIAPTKLNDSDKPLKEKCTAAGMQALELNQPQEPNSVAGK